MRKIATLYFLIVFIQLSCSKKSELVQLNQPDFFIKGADCSFLPEIESSQTLFYDSNNQAKNLLQILKDYGCNTIRLRLWKNPSNEHSGFAEVRDLSKRIKTLNMKVYLTVHYSDTWADPANQNIPNAWSHLNFQQLKDSVYDYTEYIIKSIQPDYIQIGNEINNGFLWPKGHVQNNSQFLDLIDTASLAIRRNSTSSKIIIHFAGQNGAVNFFQNLKNTNYDYIGISYYPKWHGKNLTNLSHCMDSLGLIFNKPVLIAETAYPFSLGYNDWTNNVIGSNDEIIYPEYPATEIGQKEFLIKIIDLNKRSNKGCGVCYWGAEWVSYKGTQATDGSSWENQALFDFQNKAVPALNAFE